MKKIKITKRQRKAQGRNFAWMCTREISFLKTHEIAGSEYLGRQSDWRGRTNIPFIRIG